MPSVHAGVAPRAVWLVPAKVAMPKASPPLAVKPDVEPKSGGSPSHPLIEFEFAHKCDTGPTVLAMIGQPGLGKPNRILIWQDPDSADSDRRS